MPKAHESKSDAVANPYEGIWTARILSEAAEQSRNYFEKGIRAIQDETLQLMNRRMDHNGSSLAEVQHCKDMSELMDAQRKWFAEFNRDYYEALLRFNEMAHRLVTEGLATTNGEVKETAEKIKQDMAA